MPTKFTLIQGDITQIEADAIVNAANSSLLGGGGVDGAIHRAGGPAILEECIQIRNKQGGCEIGEAVITTAGRLPARHVIHTVGPVWQGGNNRERELLSNCYRSVLKLAVAHGIKTLAFPNISTGIYRFPKAEAAAEAMAAVQEFVATHPHSLEEISFVCFDDENHQLYEQLLKDK